MLRATAEVNGLLPTALDLHILLFLLLVVFQNTDNARVCAQSINVEQHDLNLEIAVTLGLPLNIVQNIPKQVLSIQYAYEFSALVHRDCQ